MATVLRERRQGSIRQGSFRQSDLPTPETITDKTTVADLVNRLLCKYPGATKRRLLYGAQALPNAIIGMDRQFVDDPMTDRKIVGHFQGRNPQSLLFVRDLLMAALTAKSEPESDEVED